jgi:two-component system cell cycle response regulator DivK
MPEQHALILDDNPMNLSALEQLLKRENVAVTALTNPREVGEVLDNGTRFDVVFLDLEFPNANGMDLVADLKTYPALAGVPIIACTVHISELTEARDAGFDGFIGKPLNVSEFPDQLARILAGDAVWEASQ